MIEIEAWAARGEDGMLYLYRDKPKKGDKQWYSNSLTCTGLIFLSDEMSPRNQMVGRRADESKNHNREIVWNTRQTSGRRT